MKTYHVNPEGYYGEFGGAYVPEILYKTVEDLRKAYLPILESDEFQKEYHALLKDYVGRPSPLYHARRMSEKYGCKLYLKREDLNHTGAHKINNEHVNVERMKMLGAEVFPVESGNKTLKDATNEAIRDWCCHPADTFYIIGSTVGPHPYPDLVARLQSVISQEIREQLMEKEGRDYPDYLMACVGGGSNAAGTIYHYVDDERVRIYLGEAGGHGIDSGETAATIHRGSLGILHGSRTLVMQDEDGQIIEPYSLSAGLDYPGIGPLHANLAATRRATVMAVNDDEALRAAFELTRLEGIIPALESAHALGMLPRMRFRKDDVVVLTVSGRGDKDIDTYLAHQHDASLQESTPANH